MNCDREDCRHKRELVYCMDFEAEKYHYTRYPLREANREQTELRKYEIKNKEADK